MSPPATSTSNDPSEFVAVDAPLTVTSAQAIGRPFVSITHPENSPCRSQQAATSGIVQARHASTATSLILTRQIGSCLECLIEHVIASPKDVLLLQHVLLDNLSILPSRGEVKQR